MVIFEFCIKSWLNMDIFIYFWILFLLKNKKIGFGLKCEMENSFNENVNITTSLYPNEFKIGICYHLDQMYYIYENKRILRYMVHKSPKSAWFDMERPKDEQFIVQSKSN